MPEIKIISPAIPTAAAPRYTPAAPAITHVKSQEVSRTARYIALRIIHAIGDKTINTIPVPIKTELSFGKFFCDFFFVILSIRGYVNNVNNIIKMIK